MGTTTQPLGPDFVNQLISGFYKAFEEATKMAYHRIWEILLILLKEHWGLVLIVLFIVLVAAFVRYMVTGRWAILGSVLYNYFYFGILFVITLIFGPEIFASDYIKILFLVLYVICFTMVGKLFRR